MSDNEMLKRISTWTPLVSGVALATLTVFNVGYFSKIGIHFLGVVDFSNVVYSFGLAFGVVGMLFLLIGFDTFDYVRKPIDFEKAFPFTLALKVIAAIVFLSFLLGLVFDWQYLRTDIYGAIASFFTAFCIGLHGYVRLRASGNLLPSDYILAFATALIALLFSGRAVAEGQIVYRLTYNVTTTDGSLNDVRLVRSSSMGFIIAEGRKILFIPASQVKQIESRTPAN